MLAKRPTSGAGSVVALQHDGNAENPLPSPDGKQIAFRFGSAFDDPARQCGWDQHADLLQDRQDHTCQPGLQTRGTLPQASTTMTVRCRLS
jgi:hypothetical protein